MAPNSNPPTFELHFQDSVRVAGDIVKGRVQLNLARAQDEGVDHLHVTLRGCIVTKIIESNSDGSDTKHEETIELINSEKKLWERGTVFSDPGSHLLALPFQFTLPDDLPPSFHLSLPRHHKAVISYAIEVVGTRSGRRQKERQVRKIFPVLPAASPVQILAKTTQKQGWTGPWKTVSLDQKVRQGIWGDHSHARAEVKIPDVASLPRATAWPLKFFIETQTKSMSRTESPMDKHNKPLFPAPPTQPADVTLFFHREASIRALRRHATANDSFPILGSLGDPTSATVKTTIGAAEWIPDPEKRDRGVWKRTVQFEAMVSLPFAPTFSTETVECKYFLHFTVPFPGSGNKLKLRVPIHLDPAHACHSFVNGRSKADYADVPPDGPHPDDALLDFPPAYWTVADIIS
ncbi:hypothetical protein DFH09DRAFT_220274 [Mycena vulgaris]|nr:hypothetical protein DFH09DRAFT_220274 [Mycena vulgaris]